MKVYIVERDRGPTWKQVWVELGAFTSKSRAEALIKKQEKLDIPWCRIREVEVEE